MTGNSPCYRFLQIEAWNACRIFYSFGLTRPLQAPEIFFLGLKSKIRDRAIVALDQENRLDTHYVWFGCELMNPNSQLWKWRWLFREPTPNTKKWFSRPPEASISRMTKLFVVKRGQISSSKPPILDYTCGKHVVNTRWLNVKKWSKKVDFFG